MSPITTDLIQQTIHYISLNPPRVANCLARISEAQLWEKPNAQTNSIGNLILHLCGNIRQYLIAGLGGEADIRQRDKEFSTGGGYNKAALLLLLEETVEAGLVKIANTTEAELLQASVIQGIHYTGVGILLHVSEHFSYHVGQIALYTKLWTAEDLGFYADYDL